MDAQHRLRVVAVRRQQAELRDLALHAGNEGVGAGRVAAAVQYGIQPVLADDGTHAHATGGGPARRVAEHHLAERRTPGLRGQDVGLQRLRIGRQYIAGVVERVSIHVEGTGMGLR